MKYNKIITLKNGKEAFLRNGVVAGTAGIEAVGKKYKLKHRAELGIAILKEFWGLGIGKGLVRLALNVPKTQATRSLSSMQLPKMRERWRCTRR